MRSWGRFEMLSRLSGVHTERTAIGRFLTGQAASVTALRDSIDEATTAYSRFGGAPMAPLDCSAR